MPVYFEKVNCIKEMIRAILRNKPIILLLPDIEEHGEFTVDMIRDIITDAWVEKWKIAKLVEKMASEWGVFDLKTPTPSEICDALFKWPALEWSRITAFQNRVLVLICERVLPEGKRGIYMQGVPKFVPPKGFKTLKVYCSENNVGAAGLIEELDEYLTTNKSLSPTGTSTNNLSADTTVSSRGTSIGDSRTTRSSKKSAGKLFEVVGDVGASDHMLVYLNANTWVGDSEALATDIREAQRLGVHLQPCHEFPSVLDTSSSRAAQDFKTIMEATPPPLKSGEGNVYKQIAIAMKGGELREVGLVNLALKLAQRVPRAPLNVKDRKKSSILSPTRKRPAASPQMEDASSC